MAVTAVISQGGGDFPVLCLQVFLSLCTKFDQNRMINGRSTYGISLIFKMAAAAIFENGDTLPVLRFLNSACSF
jgi:hypothetical protein